MIRLIYRFLPYFLYLKYELIDIKRCSNGWLDHYQSVTSIKWRLGSVATAINVLVVIVKGEQVQNRSKSTPPRILLHEAGREDAIVVDADDAEHGQGW